MPATASGILNGPVDFTVTKSGPDGTCEFARADSLDKLRIEVVASATALAGYKSLCTTQAVSLKAIGNEAAACGVNADAEQVAGRVRKQAFLVRVSGNAPAETLRKRAIAAAEHVAGNLF